MAVLPVEMNAAWQAPDRALLELLAVRKDESRDLPTLEEVSGRRIAGTDFPSTECVVNGVGGGIGDGQSELSSRISAAKFSSTEAVICSAEPELSKKKLHKVAWRNTAAQRRWSDPVAENGFEFARHRSSHSKAEAVVVFLPGCHGGVGPCRSGRSSDSEKALFPMLAEELSHKHPLECYRITWTESYPPMEETVVAVCRVVLHALTAASVGLSPAKTMRVFLVGHSFGAGVALNAARRLVDMVAPLQAEVGGVVALATQWAGDCLLGLNVPKLFVHGKDDEDLTYQVTLALYALCSEPREIVIIPKCDHNFSEHKLRLFRSLTDWIVSKYRCSAD